MPFMTTPDRNSLHVSNSLPKHLKHKPVYVLPYEQFDGHFADDQDFSTDVRYVSIGIAQYESKHVSVKTMRHTGLKWSRQSEELPVHRAIDATLFLALALFADQTDELVIPAGTFHNQTDAIEISAEDRSAGESAKYRAFLKEHMPLYRERLGALYDVLAALKEDGDI